MTTARETREGRLLRAKKLGERFLALMHEGAKSGVFRKKIDPLWNIRFAELHRDMTDLVAELEKPVIGAPIPMLLRCPVCHTRHIDEGSFETSPHKTHACQKCGEHFRPSNEYTVGVQFLPGAKNS